MGDMESFSEWLSRVTNGASHRAIARELEVQNGALSRWIRTDTIPPRTVIEIARIYNADPIEALCVTGFLDEGEVIRHQTVALLRDASDLDIVEELHRRILRREVEREATGPVQPIVEHYGASGAE